jgi:hypothetical protein
VLIEATVTFYHRNPRKSKAAARPEKGTSLETCKPKPCHGLLGLMAGREEEKRLALRVNRREENSLSLKILP